MDLTKSYLEAYRNTIFFILFQITSIIFFYTFQQHLIKGNFLYGVICNNEKEISANRHIWFICTKVEN